MLGHSVCARLSGLGSRLPGATSWRQLAQDACAHSTASGETRSETRRGGGLAAWPIAVTGDSGGCQAGIVMSEDMKLMGGDFEESGPCFVTIICLKKIKVTELIV